MTDPIATLNSSLTGRYRVERELGAGGMATVYLAEDVRHHRQVAIKVVRPELTATLAGERFLHEITTTASFRHPHVMPLYDSGESEGILYYVMPFIEGESLRERLNREKQLPVDDALRITTEVADALSYAHAHGVVHRDIKPENILLEGGHAVVADFGIARALDVAGGQRITATGVSIGTPAYMSPEQVAGERDVDARSDVYSLACVLYEMIAGQPPFAGPTAASVLHQHMVAAAPVAAHLRPGLAKNISAAIERGLQKTPADRFPTVKEFADALAGHTTTSSARGFRRGWLVAAAAAVIIIAVIAFALTKQRPLAPLQLGKRTAVTQEPGLELDPALSPDGKLVAYSDRQGSLTVRQVDGGAPVQVLHSDDKRGRWPAWLADGQRLLFVSPKGIEVVSALGGARKLLVAGVNLDRGITADPNGPNFAFVSHDSLLSAPVDGGAPRLVTVGSEIHSPAWSPDGKWIAFVQGNKQYIGLADLGNVAHTGIWIAPALGGTPHRVTDERSLHASPAWAAARTLLFVSDQDGGRDAYQLALTRSGSPSGAPVRITTGLNPHGITVSSDGRRLAYSAFTETSNVWSLPIPSTGEVSVSTAVAETQGSQLIENFGVSNDGQWLGYNTSRGGPNQVLRQRVGVKNAEVQQLTSDTIGSFWVSWSPDAKAIAFHRFIGGKRQSFVSPVEGGPEVPITDGTEDERSPEFSPDGREVMVLTNWGTHPVLHVVHRGNDGRWSKPRTLPIVFGKDTIPAGLADWSPDGRFVACGCGEGGLVIAPVDGGQARRLSSQYSTTGWALPQWSSDGRTVYHVTEDSGRVVAVVAVPVDGSAPHKVVRMDDPSRPWHRYGFRVRGGRIFFTLGNRESDVWVTDIEHE